MEAPCRSALGAVAESSVRYVCYRLDTLLLHRYVRDAARTFAEYRPMI